jgi:hypothetical protein
MDSRLFSPGKGTVSTVIGLRKKWICIPMRFFGFARSVNRLFRCPSPLDVAPIHATRGCPSLLAPWDFGTTIRGERIMILSAVLAGMIIPLENILPVQCDVL